MINLDACALRLDFAVKRRNLVSGSDAFETNNICTFIDSGLFTEGEINFLNI